MVVQLARDYRAEDERTAKRRTLRREPVLGSNTLRTSLVNAATEVPTVPDLTTNDLGVLGRLGSTDSAGLTWCDARGRKFELGWGSSD